MKYLVLTLMLVLTSALPLLGQNSIPSTEQKQTINPIIDLGFTQWSKSWSYDRYVGRSSKITSITIDEDYGDIEVSGDFNYNRLKIIESGTFTAKLSITNGNLRLLNIRYIDSNGLTGSKSF